MGESWTDIPGYGGHYQASTLGRVRSKSRVVTRRHPKSGELVDFRYKGRILSPSMDDEGYLRVHLGVGGQKFNVRVHHLVLLAYEGPRPAGMEGCHRDNRPSNNRPGNLHWGTHAENNAHRKDSGNYANGERHHMAKFSDAMAVKVKGMTRAEALAAGVSASQYYRIRNGVRANG